MEEVKKLFDELVDYHIERANHIKQLVEAGKASHMDIIDTQIAMTEAMIRRQQHIESMSFLYGASQGTYTNANQ
jgi:hypothetical protein